ncbi:MAG: hypothetical protein ACHREM_04090 [Polyangiales bacterium]
MADEPETKSSKKTDGDIMFERGEAQMKLPLLARLPSEPGWRAIVGKPEEGEGDDRKCLYVLTPVHAWGFEQQNLFLQEDPKPAPARGSGAAALLSYLLGAFGQGRTAPVHVPCPLDESGNRLGPVVIAIVDPTISDEDAMRRFKMTLDKATAKHEADVAARAKVDAERKARAAEPPPG